MLEKRVVTFPSRNSRERNNYRQKFKGYRQADPIIKHEQRFADYRKDIEKYLNFPIEIDSEEKAILGKCVISDDEIVPCIPPRFYRKLNRNERIREKNKVLNKLFSFVKDHQPQTTIFQSENPEIMNNIVRSIKIQIENLPELGGKVKNIGWYTALNTPLDYQHGIDGWIEIEEQGEDQPIRLFFDLKTGNKKPGNYNSHGVATFHVNMDSVNNYSKDDPYHFSEENIRAIELFEKKLMDEYKHKKELLYRY